MSRYYRLRDEREQILKIDDKESFVEFCHRNPDEVDGDLVLSCCFHQAKECLIALVSGEVCEPPPALEGCATCIHKVVSSFRDLDVINIMLARGAIKDLNIKYKYHVSLCGTPLHLLDCLTLSDTDLQDRHLDSWSPGDSIFKLITLLCMWEMKNLLDIARKLACYTDSINDIAWNFLENGKLLQFTALLLVAQKKVMAPFETGMTIQQCVARKIDELSSDNEHEHAQYKSLLMDASKVLDVFERIGEDLSAYCTSLHKDVTPDIVVVDVTGLFRKAGIVLQLVDLDLRDSYRGHLGVWKADLFELSDSPKLNDKFPPYFPSVRDWDPLIGKLKSNEVVKLAATIPIPRFFSTTTAAGSRIPAKHLAYVALKMKRGIRL